MPIVEIDQGPEVFAKPEDGAPTDLSGSSLGEKIVIGEASLALLTVKHADGWIEERWAIPDMSNSLSRRCRAAFVIRGGGGWSADGAGRPPISPLWGGPGVCAPPQRCPMCPRTHDANSH